MADGSVIVIGKGIDPKVLKSLTTAAGHETIDGAHAY
jgi:hypothetical protein